MANKALGLALILASALAPCLSAAADAADAADAVTVSPVKAQDEVTVSLVVKAPEVVEERSDASATAVAITTQGGLLSVNVSQVPFNEVLAQLAEQTNIKLFVLGDTVPSEAFSAAFDNLPLQDAIVRLLEGKSYVMRYTTEEASSAPRIAAIYIVPQGSEGPKPARILQVGKQPDEQPETDTDVDTVLLEVGLQAEKAADRAAALKKYLEEAEELDYETVAKSLKDVDPQVRQVALEGLENASDLGSMWDATAEVALKDADPTLRMNALDLLVQQGAIAPQQVVDSTIKDAIKQAMVDSDPAVQAHAQEAATFSQHIEQWRIKREAAIAAQQNAKPK